MKLIKMLILAIILLAIMAVVAGLFMDPEWQVERRTVVKAAPGEVFGYISRIQSWQEWTAWNTQAYPEMKISYSGPPSGVGARQSWDDGVMTGYVEIARQGPGRQLDYIVSMDEGKHTMDCSMAVESSAGGSEVRWACSGDSGNNPFDRLMMAAYKPMIGKDFEKGLANLKKRYKRGN